MATDCAHVFGPERRYVGFGGPMEGSWLVADCVHCNTFALRSEEAPDTIYDDTIYGHPLSESVGVRSCANPDCGVPIGTEFVLQCSTRHVRWFCSNHCLLDSWNRA